MAGWSTERLPHSSFLSRNFSSNTHPLWTPGLASLTKMVPGHGWMGQTTRRASSEYVCSILCASTQVLLSLLSRFKGKMGSLDWLGVTASWAQHLFGVLRFWSPQQPDNWNGREIQGEEDCAHFMDSGQWNDNVCTRSFYWVCEKKLGRAS